jgi:hypothetical protein
MTAAAQKMEAKERINTFPMTGIGVRTRTLGMAAALHRRKMHGDSLLAWAEEVMTSRKKAASDPLLMSFEKPKGARGMVRLSAADKKMAILSIDVLIEKYLEETKRPLTRSFDAEASLRSPEMPASIKTFAEAYDVATKKKKVRGMESWSAKAAEGEVPSALSHLLSTVEDFVTPGDLLTCGDLYHVGKIEIEA